MITNECNAKQGFTMTQPFDTPHVAAALFDALNVVGNAESDENERPDAHADG